MTRRFAGRVVRDVDSDAVGSDIADAALRDAAFDFLRGARPEASQVLILEDDAGTAVGAALILLTGAAHEIVDIAVHPGHRRRGAGRVLLDAIIDDALAEGQPVWLEVRADNAAARALYDGAGFVQTGTRPGYYRGEDGARIDAIAMALEVGD